MNRRMLRWRGSSNEPAFQEERRRKKNLRAHCRVSIGWNVDWFEFESNADGLFIHFFEPSFKQKDNMTIVWIATMAWQSI